jgi:hypothetical protein
MRRNERNKPEYKDAAKDRKTNCALHDLSFTWLDFAYCYTTEAGMESRRVKTRGNGAGVTELCR